YVGELSHKRRDRLAPEILVLHRLLTAHGPAAFARAVTRLLAGQLFGQEYLTALLEPTPAPAAARPAAPPLALPGVPTQADLDPPLGAYEAFVRGARPPSASGGPPPALFTTAPSEVPA